MLSNGDHPMERLELLAQRDLSRTRDAVGTAAVLGFQGLNSATSL